MDAKQTILLRTRIAFLGLFVFAVAIVAKLIHIQFVQGKKWTKLAQVATLEYRPIQPSRGNIYAQDGNLLATSLPFYKVAIDPCIADNELFEANIKLLSTLLAEFYQDKPAQAYYELLCEARRNRKRYLLLNNKQITHHDKRKMSEWPIFREGRFRGGVIFEKTEKRFKPFRELAARTLGFVNKNRNGVGLECSFDQILRGVEGGAVYQKLTGGSWKMIQSSNTKKPINGYDLITTLDINLQDVAHTSLLKVLQQSQANYGAVVVMEVATGEIKAMVNLGSVAPGQYQEIYNYAAGSQGTTEPGSIFKLVSMLALLEESNLELTDTVDTGEGKYKFHNLTMSDVKRGGHGIITLQEAFEQSSNIGIAKLIDNTFSEKPQKFIDYIRQLGLDKPLGIQLQGEGIPFVKHPKHRAWTKVTLPWMSMGYEVKLTPLQLLTVYNAIANHGKMLKPILVKEIRYANRTIETFTSTVLNKKICSDQTLKKLQTMLEGVVERGTAKKFKHGFYKIAGKSGTSNKIKNGKYSDATYASFVGYFPADKPRYSCIVVIDDPQGAEYHYGGQVAAPVVKEIANKLSAKDLVSAPYITPIDSTEWHTPPPKFRVAYKDDWQVTIQTLGINFPSPLNSDEWLQVIQQEEETIWKPYSNFSTSQVPRVVGMPLRDALFLLESRGLQVTLQGYTDGYVKAQSLTPGTQVKPGQTITLELN
ncbi:MAG: penicillin-binding protein [Candidatus Amoebophilus sp.]